MRLPSLLLLLTLLFTACGSDANPDVDGTATLEGRWILEEARRDNVKTGVFDNLYFVFGADGMFQTNLPPGEQTGTWKRDGNEITTAGVEVPLTFTIEYLDEEELDLRSTYEGFLFDFALARSTQGEVTEAD